MTRTSSTDRHPAALLVAAGMLISRLAGFVRLRVFAHYFGLQSDAADAFNAAFRIPNFLQNLFGEGALSASFIPVYASLLAKDDGREADRVAGAVGSLMGLIVSALVLIGMLASPILIHVIAPGFSGDKRELTITLVRILFPGSGLLVLSAWCLGVLNSHRRFLLSYAAPVGWNAAMIATLVIWGPTSVGDQLAMWLAWGSVAGSVLQLVVQLPAVRSVAPGLRFELDLASSNVRTVFTNFIPVFISRGVVQISAYIDALLASLLPTGAVTGLANAQLLYTLPISLFGMSVAASELPAMSGEVGADPAASEALRRRLNAGLRQIAVFSVPSAAAFFLLGDVVTAAVLETGRFSHADARYVWGILAGSAVGLVTSTLGRLYASTYYALRDTRTPLRCALVRVALTTALGYVFAVPLPRWLGVPPLWGAAGLTVSAGIAGWAEMLLLRHWLNRRLGWTGLGAFYAVKLWVSAAAGAAIAWGIKLQLPPLHPVFVAAFVLVPYGVVFFGAASLLGVPEASVVRRRVLRF